MGGGCRNNGDSGPDERLPTDERHARDAQCRDDSQRVLCGNAAILCLSGDIGAATYATGAGQLLRPRAQQPAELDAMERWRAYSAGTDGADIDLSAGSDTDRLRTDAFCRSVLYVAAVHRLHTY